MRKVKTITYSKIPRKRKYSRSLKKAKPNHKYNSSSRSDPPGIYISIDELEIDLSPITLDDRKISTRKRSPKRKY